MAADKPLGILYSDEAVTGLWPSAKVDNHARECIFTMYDLATGLSEFATSRTRQIGFRWLTRAYDRAASTRRPSVTAAMQGLPAPEFDLAWLTWCWQCVDDY